MAALSDDAKAVCMLRFVTGRDQENRHAWQTWPGLIACVPVAALPLLAPCYWLHSILE